MTKYACHTHTHTVRRIRYNKRRTKANVRGTERRGATGTYTPGKEKERQAEQHTLEYMRKLTEAFALIGGSIDKDFGADYVAEG